MKKSRISNFIMLYILFLVFVFPISFGDLGKVEAAEFQGEVDEDTIVEIMNAKPSETNVGGYSIDAITQAGMGKNFDHPLYSLNIVVLSCSTGYDQELNGSAGEIVLQYKFMPKVDGFYKFRYDDLLAEGIWTDALGNTIPFVK
ncbi:MAG: hypothetical protein IJ733_00615, partial [Lachnospiraceae bacterium]|nr:hypothetical protein [Lachnospiraceae bacterium]